MIRGRRSDRTEALLEVLSRLTARDGVVLELLLERSDARILHRDLCPILGEGVLDGLAQLTHEVAQHLILLPQAAYILNYLLVFQVRSPRGRKASCTTA